jgi:hypothetical protein
MDGRIIRETQDLASLRGIIRETQDLASLQGTWTAESSERHKILRCYTKPERRFCYEDEVERILRSISETRRWVSGAICCIFKLVKRALFDLEVAVDDGDDVFI